MYVQRTLMGIVFCESIFFASVDKNLDKLYPGSLLCRWHYKWLGCKRMAEWLLTLLEIYDSSPLNKKYFVLCLHTRK